MNIIASVGQNLVRLESDAPKTVAAKDSALGADDEIGKFLV